MSKKLFILGSPETQILGLNLFQAGLFFRNLEINIQTIDKQRHPSEVLIPYGETPRFCEGAKEKDMDFQALTDGKALRAIIIRSSSKSIDFH